MNRVTFNGNFCDIAKCATGGADCTPLEVCDQRKVWERLKAIEDILGDSYDLEELKQRWGYAGLVGKTVYGIRRRNQNRNRKGIMKTYDRAVTSPRLMEQYPDECYVAERVCVRSDLPKLGATVFLSAEEATEALAGKGGHNVCSQ